MSYCGVSIFSDNLSGQTANVTFFPCTGGTISLGDQVFPFTYVSDYWYGTYDCYVSTYAYSYVVDVPCPSSTPTPTPTVTPTETVPLTPTNTETPTPTPTNSETPTPTITSSETPTPTITSSATPTFTPTPTQTPTPINYVFQLIYGSNPNEACSGTNQAYYGTRSGGPTIDVGEILYTNEGTTSPAPNGYYAEGITLYKVDSSLYNIPGEVTGKWNSGCLNLVTPTPTITNTATNSPTPTATVTQTPTNTPTPTNTLTPTVTETPTNTPTVTVTPSITSSNTPTPSITSSNTPTPSITASQTVTPTPTHIRYPFSLFKGTNFADACSQLYGGLIYGDSPDFSSNTQFYNNSTGPVTINMTGFYSFSNTVLQLNSNGFVIGSPFSCI
jgi:hypothetical protein